ncbi:MAG: hypothetical protein P4L46_18730 [Fimbriimonas sp.]|nr:hypothetical protein [Fimbriimonas sp.]
MTFDHGLAARLREVDKYYFSSLAPTVRQLGVVQGEPFLALDGGFAFHAGNGSPLTQAGGRFDADDLVEIQSFYRGRTKHWEAVVTPFSDSGAIDRLIALDAAFMGWENMLFIPVPSAVDTNNLPDGAVIEDVSEDNAANWADVATRGFCPGDVPQAFVDLAKMLTRSSAVRKYLVTCHGIPAAAASLTVHQGVAFLGGMATLPAFRGQGLQSCMIRRRLVDARSDADIAFVGASPGTTSHRNVERAGFRVAYSQLSLKIDVRTDG